MTGRSELCSELRSLIGIPPARGRRDYLTRSELLCITQWIKHRRREPEKELTGGNHIPKGLRQVIR